MFDNYLYYWKILNKTDGKKEKILQKLYLFN